MAEKLFIGQVTELEGQIVPPKADIIITHYDKDEPSKSWVRRTSKNRLLAELEASGPSPAGGTWEDYVTSLGWNV